MSQETIIPVSAARLRELLLAERKLLALTLGGVDNWEWYSDSLSDQGYFSFNEEFGNVDDDKLQEYL